MKNDKITIYMVSPLEKAVWTVIGLFSMGALSIPFIMMSIGELEVDWAIICGSIISGLILLYFIFLKFFKRIVYDERLGVLKLYHFRLRAIPLQDIKIMKRDKYIYGRKFGRYCYIDLKLIGGGEKRIELSVPLFFGQKSWLEHIDQEIADLNKRIATRNRIEPGF